MSLGGSISFGGELFGFLVQHIDDALHEIDDGHAILSLFGEDAPHTYNLRLGCFQCVPQLRDFLYEGVLLFEKLLGPVGVEGFRAFGALS